MSFEITTAFVEQFGTNIELLAQQKGSRLRMCVREETVTGEDRFFDQISKVAAQKRTSRHGDTPLISTSHDRRMVTPEDYEWADLIDSLDKVKMLSNPESAYCLNAANAFGRSIDDEIILAATGAALTGKKGTTSVAFPTATHTIAGGSTGFTLAKILAAKRILDEYENDEDEQRFIACTAQQIEGLLNITEVGSSDYNTVKALAAGDIDTFCGFTFKRIERLAFTTPNRSCLAWCKNSLLLGVGSDFKKRITERADKNYSTQVFAEMSIGATRMDETGVVEILCDET